ncbi:MAG: DUF5640 domain-containing protein [Bacilli bacterium]|nr:DUF5640 domain-containing protein [Bacilli bacterium]
MKKKKKQKQVKRIIILVLIILIVLSFSIIAILKTKKKENNNPLIGKWTTDNVTVYIFNKDNTGELKVPLSTYKFNYKINKNNLYIDFANEKSEDTKYTYNFENGRLILESKNGKFIFHKQK